jgi:LacI family transcriptional regulator
MTVTIRDVADRAGVSVATVSRALSGSRRVSPDLAARVADAADELGYRHNALARALRRGQTNTVGMVVPEIGNPFFPTVVEAVERTLAETRRDLFLCDSQLDAETERRRVRALVGRKIDGLIIIPVSATHSAASLREAVGRVPVVQVDRYVPGFDADWVGVDERAGITRIIEHLFARGARRCVFVSARPDSSAAQERLADFDTAARTHRIACDEPLLGAFSAEWGRQAAVRLLALPTLPDAVVCGNDEIAVGVLCEFRRRQIRVPEQVWVTGFDDIRFALLTDPPLTTVRQPHEQMATECVRLLDERIADPEAPIRRVAVTPTLVIRESTGGPS